MATPPTGAAMAMMVVLTLDWLLALWIPLVVSALDSSALVAASVCAAVPAVPVVEVRMSSVVELLDGGMAKGAAEDEMAASGGRLAVPVDEMIEETDERSEVAVDSVVGVGVGVESGGEELAGVEMAEEAELEEDEVGAAAFGVVAAADDDDDDAAEDEDEDEDVDSGASDEEEEELGAAISPPSLLALFVVPSLPSSPSAAEGGGALAGAPFPCPPPRSPATPSRSPPLVFGEDILNSD